MNHILIFGWLTSAIASIGGGLLLAEVPAERASGPAALLTGGGIAGLICLTAKLVASDRRHRRLIAHQEAKDARDHAAKMESLRLERDCLRRHNEWVTWAQQIKTIIPHLPEPPDWVDLEPSAPPDPPLTLA